eukprot:COSAG02_NODE_6258_length_3697_cov_9.967482_3_plen_62_part_00
MQDLGSSIAVLYCSTFRLGWSIKDRRSLQLKEGHGIDCCDCARIEVERRRRSMYQKSAVCV